MNKHTRGPAGGVAALAVWAERTHRWGLEALGSKVLQAALARGAVQDLTLLAQQQQAIKLGPNVRPRLWL